MITTLIDKQDSFEIIRDQIAAILKTESLNQMQIAGTEGKDPQGWALRVYTERSNPWEQVLNDPTDNTPIVNVWFSDSTFDPSTSNISERQASESTFNIDCYGIGVSRDDGDGHIPGDKEAAFETQRTIRLVRNILMASEYTYLALRGLVWQRWPQSVTVFQPQSDSTTVQQVVGSRLTMRVKFNEFSPQYEHQTLELLSTTMTRAGDGQIVVAAEYDYT